jgi:hypothetical protein
MPTSRGTRPPAAGKGRPKGAANKMTRALKDMILGALDEAGGQQYLARQAEKNPAAFMTLLGRVLPLEVAGDGGGALVIRWLGEKDEVSRMAAPINSAGLAGLPTSRWS